MKMRDLIQIVENVSSDQLYFHGSWKDFNKFETQIKAVVSTEASEVPIFFSPTFNLAALNGPLVYVCKLNVSNTFDATDLFLDVDIMRTPEMERLTPLGLELYDYIENLDGINEPFEVIEYIGTYSWDILEENSIKHWIRSKGYDSFYVSEGGIAHNKVLNVGVFDPNDIQIVDKVIAEGKAGSARPEYSHYKKVSSYP